MTVQVVEGDLLEQPTEAIVNAWNRNIIPWWLLLPQGVSGAINKWAGYEPFRELARMGTLPLGASVHTSAGRLPYKAIIHVAGINLLWRATEQSIRLSTRNAIELAGKLDIRSVAFPVIGAGSGGFGPREAEAIMLQTFAEVESGVNVVLVRYVEHHKLERRCAPD